MKNQLKKDNQYWENHILRWQNSGLSKNEYCRRENISYWTFRDRIKKQNITGSKKLVRLPRAIHSFSGNVESGIEIKIGNKISINVNRGFDGELLRNLLNEIGAAE